MALSRNREKGRQCARFLNRYEETDINKATMPLLEFYQNYKEYVAVNAIGYELSIKEFEDEIQKKFPNVKISSGVIRGLVPRPKRQPIEIKPDPFDTLMIHRCQSLKSHELRPYFRATQLQNYNEVDNQKIELEKVVDWLHKSQFIFYCESTDSYHFNQDYQQIIRAWST